MPALATTNSAQKNGSYSASRRRYYPSGGRFSLRLKIAHFSPLLDEEILATNARSCSRPRALVWPPAHRRLPYIPARLSPKELGIQMIPAYSPQARGRMERRDLAGAPAAGASQGRDHHGGTCQ